MVVGQHFKNAAASSKVMTFDSFGLSVAGVVVEPLETQRRRVECSVSNCNLFIARLPEDPDCSSAVQPPRPAVQVGALHSGSMTW
jgi:hypothetical protein